MTGHERGFGGRPRVWVIAVLVAAIFTILGTPRTASAHNALDSTTPAAGSTVATPPAAVVLTFNEPAIATGTKVLVTGPDGSATQGDPELVDSTVRQELEPGLPAGSYTVDWRVTSADGHPVNGTFTFQARAGGPSSDGSSAPAASPASEPASAGSAVPPAGSPTRSGWLWLLAIVPIGLAVALGWRFSRRTAA